MCGKISREQRCRFHSKEYQMEDIQMTRGRGIPKKTIRESTKKDLEST